MEKLECLNQETILLLKEYNCLKDLIGSILVEQAVNTVKFSTEEYNTIQEQVKKQSGINPEISLDDWLEKNKSKISLDHYIKTVIFPYKLKKYCLEKFKTKTEARFLKKKDNFDIIVYSLIRVKDVYLANELYQRINEGEADFSDIAVKYSEGGEKNTRGIIGPLPLGQAMEPLKEFLKSSKPGHLRRPIQIDQWHLLVRVESITHAKLDEEMMEILSKELFYEWINREVEIQVEKLFERFPTKENILV